MKYIQIVIITVPADGLATLDLEGTANAKITNFWPNIDNENRYR